jgi:hypothetical protein
MTWRPRARDAADLSALPLDPPQGALLTQLDGRRDLPDLARELGLDPADLASRLDELVTLGAVEPEEADAPAEAEDGDEDEGEPAAQARATTHRALFEQELRAWPEDQRVALARVAVEPDLSALCFDPVPEVIRALMENPQVGGVQARLIAAHHRTTAGLEVLGGRAAFTADEGVRRALLKNPLLPAALFRRLWAPRRLLEQYLTATSREAPEQVRAMARDLLRASFTQRTGEEKAELILSTEGRCLASLVGLTLDGHATALLCRRTYVSTLLIQNLARWSATPPQLIAHLRRQDAVRRNAPLRQLLERHPNAS